MHKCIRTLALVLLFCLLLPMGAALAAEESPAPSPVPQDVGILDGIVLQSKIDKFLAEWSIDPGQISVGYCYTPTGDTWYYNGDEWFYPASMYKVPLIMLLSEKVKSGEISQDTDLGGDTVANVEELILTYSNNNWAHAVRKYLGGDSVWREQAKQYADLKESEYDPDYMDYCYFNNRYMTSVMKTLYYEAERFPNVIDCLLIAEPGQYYNIAYGDTYDIAQKYGSFKDSMGEDFHHCSAIIYTPNPCIITVMTSNLSNFETVINELGKIFVEHTLMLDEKLSGYEQEQAEKAAEEERLRLEAEAELQRQIEEQQRLEAEKAAEEERIQQETEAKIKRNEVLSKVLKIAVALLVLLVLLLVLVLKLKARCRQQEDYDDYYDDDDDDYPPPPPAPRGGRAAPRSSAPPRGRGGYTPRH